MTPEGVYFLCTAGIIGLVMLLITSYQAENRKQFQALWKALKDDHDRQ